MKKNETRSLVITGLLIGALLLITGLFMGIPMLLLMGMLLILLGVALPPI